MNQRVAKRPDKENRTGTRKIAEFATETIYGNIPQEAIKAAKNAFLDWIGVTIAGSREPGVNIISEYARSFGARSQVSVICKGFKTVPEIAALVNGTMGHALDYDDIFPGSVHYNIHPSTSVFPAVLALVEKQKLAGRELLAAYIVGMEIHYRLGSTFGQLVPNSGWHSTPVMGTMAAAAASINLLRLSLTKAENAFGIAASKAGGMMRNIGTMTKPMHAGIGARNGVFAATMASNGFTGDSNIFDQDWGFCYMFSGKQVNGLMGTEKDLGKKWNIASVGLGFKPYPSCRSTHSSIDATLHLRNEYNITPDKLGNIIEITCKISPIHTRFCKFFTPKTGYEGKFSINYCVATALRYGKISLEDFTDNKVNDPETQALLSKVKFLHPDNWGQGAVDLTSEITINFKNEPPLSYKVTLPKGEPENPMTDKDLAIKFADCSRTALRKKDSLKVQDLILHLEEIDDLTDLFEILKGKSLNLVG